MRRSMLLIPAAILVAATSLPAQAEPPRTGFTWVLASSGSCLNGDWEIWIGTPVNGGAKVYAFYFPSSWGYFSSMQQALNMKTMLCMM